MEYFFDNLLDNIFGSFNTTIFIFDMIFGALLLIAGLFLLKKQSSKGKKTAGSICIGFGCLGILSGIIQMMFKLL